MESRWGRGPLGQKMFQKFAEEEGGKTGLLLGQGNEESRKYCLILVMCIYVTFE